MKRKREQELKCGENRPAESLWGKPLAVDHARYVRFTHLNVHTYMQTFMP